MVARIKNVGWWYIWRPVHNFWALSLPFWIARRLPRRIAYFATVRVCAHGTKGKYENQIVSELTVMDALDRWEKPNGK